MAGAMLQVLIGGLVPTLAFSLLASVAVKYFARSLPYSKAFLISLIGFAAGIFLYQLYCIANTAMGLPNSVDSLFTIVVMSVAGTIITKLARNHGVEKTGWLGVGAKSIVVLIGIWWVIAGIVYVSMRLV